MNKKFLSLVLALVMVLGTFTSVLAADDKKDDKKVVEVPKLTENDQKVNWLRENKIVEGRKVNEDEKNNDLALDKNVKRSEITKLLVYAVGKEDLADKVKGLVAVYPDVEVTYWANGYIFVGTTEESPANKLAFLNGYPDKTFKPERDVTYAELAKMLVVLTKKDLTKDMQDKAQWPTDWIKWAQQGGIFDGLKVEDVNKAANRKDAFVMVYNAMYALGEINKEVVGEIVGIASDLKDDKLTLNQGDYTKTVTIKDNTNVLDNKGAATGIASFEDQYRTIKLEKLKNDTDIEDYFVGSLVRVIVNDKDEVSHIVQLGNPEDLNVASKAMWKGLADEQIQTTVYGVTGSSQTFAKIINNKKTIQFGPTGNTTDLKVLSSTRFFVADADKNQLTEVKDIDAVIALLKIEDLNAIPYVYAGYDVDGRDDEYKDAKIVVFNQVSKANFDQDLYRVTVAAGKNSNYVLTVEDENGKTKDIDLRNVKNSWPNNFDADNKDVLLIENLAQGFTGYRARIIDASETDDFPIVKVADIDKDNFEVTLQDVEGRLKKFDVNRKVDSDFDMEERRWDFTGDVKEGDHVQFATDKNGDIFVFSIVDKDLKGDLKGGVTAKVYKGTLKDVQILDGDTNKLNLTFEELENLLGEKIVGEKTYRLNNISAVRTALGSHTLNSLKGEVLEFTIQDDTDSTDKLININVDSITAAIDAKARNAQKVLDAESAIRTAFPATTAPDTPKSVSLADNLKLANANDADKAAALKKAVKEVVGKDVTVTVDKNASSTTDWNVTVKVGNETSTASRVLTEGSNFNFVEHIVNE